MFHSSYLSYTGPSKSLLIRRCFYSLPLQCQCLGIRERIKIWREIFQNAYYPPSGLSSLRECLSFKTHRPTNMCRAGVSFALGLGIEYPERRVPRKSAKVFFGKWPNAVFSQDAWSKLAAQLFKQSVWQYSSASPTSLLKSNYCPCLF